MLAVLTGLIIATVVATDGFTQGSGGVPGDDTDKCPGIQGTASGCPDQDLDGVADGDDLCVNEPRSLSTDTNGDGCPEPITSLSYRYRLLTKPGLRVASLKLNVITRASPWLHARGPQAGAHSRVRRLAQAPASGKEDQDHHSPSPLAGLQHGVLQAEGHAKERIPRQGPPDGHPGHGPRELLRGRR